jgi:hypothetical protein
LSEHLHGYGGSALFSGARDALNPRGAPPATSAYARSEMLCSDFRIAKQQTKEGKGRTLDNAEDFK